MKLTNNLLNNQNFILWKNNKRTQQNIYLVNNLQYLFYKEFLIEKVFFFLLIIAIPWLFGYITYPNIAFLIIFIPVFASSDLRKLYKKLILYFKKIVLSDKLLLIYFRDERNRIKIIKNSIEFNTYLYFTK